MTPQQKRLACRKLCAGLGVEDIGVHLGVHPDEVRAMVSTMRRSGTIRGLLRVDKFRNADALKIMGVRKAKPPARG